MTIKKKNRQDQKTIKANSSSLEITVIQKGAMTMPKTIVLNLNNKGEKQNA